MKLILVHGVFDLLHPGHIEHLRQASKFGDTLLVSVVADAFLQKGRPCTFTQGERMEMLAACRYVQGVKLCEAPGPEALLRRLRPDVYVRGSEYIAQDKPEYAVVKELGIAVGFTAPIALHTTDILLRKPS